MKVENCDVGFIGLGVMGKSMAERLRAAGAKMHVFTRTKNPPKKFFQREPFGMMTRQALLPTVKSSLPSSATRKMLKKHISEKRAY